ncbi:MAG TPA: hypothetical protein VN081_05935 [Dongiaceae bacterium]|nr:hypothetical protein [Dongiaceae bacterium]
MTTEEQKKKHERSQRVYPQLNLSENEYVISSVRRHPIGLVLPLMLGTVLIAFALSVLLNYNEIVNNLSLSGPLASVATVALPILTFVAIVAFGMFVSYYVYTRNRFYLTNECVIQDIQYSLLNHREQTASLGSIEDASYTQNGIMQLMFNYGDIRLSTVGDETTYRMNFVARPKECIATLNNAVESFKNGRSVDADF